MFWSSKKKIPAPQHERYALAKTLYHQRLHADPSLVEVARTMGADPWNFTGEEVFRYGFHEGMIIGLTEHYLTMIDKGLDENRAVQTICAAFGRIALTDGTYPPTVPHGTNFLTYLRIFINASSRGGPEISSQILTSHINNIRAFYKR